jgi:hypothetical protein
MMVAVAVVAAALGLASGAARCGHLRDRAAWHGLRSRGFHDPEYLRSLAVGNPKEWGPTDRLTMMYHGVMEELLERTADLLGEGEPVREVADIDTSVEIAPSSRCLFPCP